MKKPDGYDEAVRRNKKAMAEHWEAFKKSDDFGVKPYFPLLVSPGLVSVESDDSGDR